MPLQQSAELCLAGGGNAAVSGPEQKFFLAETKATVESCCDLFNLIAAKKGMSAF